MVQPQQLRAKLFDIMTTTTKTVQPLRRPWAYSVDCFTI